MIIYKSETTFVIQRRYQLRNLGQGYRTFIDQLRLCETLLYCSSLQPTSVSAVKIFVCKGLCNYTFYGLVDLFNVSKTENGKFKIYRQY